MRLSVRRAVSWTHWIIAAKSEQLIGSNLLKASYSTEAFLYSKYISIIHMHNTEHWSVAPIVFYYTLYYKYNISTIVIAVRPY